MHTYINENISANNQWFLLHFIYAFWIVALLSSGWRLGVGGGGSQACSSSNSPSVGRCSCNWQHDCLPALTISTSPRVKDPIVVPLNRNLHNMTAIKAPFRSMSHAGHCSLPVLSLVQKNASSLTARVKDGLGRGHAVFILTEHPGYDGSPAWDNFNSRVQVNKTSTDQQIHLGIMFLLNQHRIMFNPELNTDLMLYMRLTLQYIRDSTWIIHENNHQLYTWD